MSPTVGHVVVVGGGLAGLQTALCCADAGAKVTLFEARPRLGGATWSFQRHGRSFDNGQHVYLRCCTAYQRFLERVGTLDDAPIQDRLSIPVISPRPDGDPVTVTLGRGALPAPLHLLGSLARFSHLSVADRVRAGLGMAALKKLRTTDAELDEETFASFLSRHGQRETGIERLFDLVTLPTVNVGADEASLLLAAKVFRTGLLGERDAGDIGWARIPLSALHGDAAERTLDKLGATIHRRARVDAIEIGRDRVGEECALGIVADGEHVKADAVVVAVPHDDAATLLPPGTGIDLSGLTELGRSPIIDVHLIFDRKVSDHPMAAALDSPVQFVFDKTDASGLDGPGQALSISVSGADKEVGERPDVLIERYRAAICDLFPKARAATLVDAVVSREHEATFRGRPGTQGIRPTTATRMANLFLAGAWTDTGWPATMEGAVRSGNRAAWHALGVLDRHHVTPQSTDEERAA
ncbi:MAG TPA: hydroxysqualene dehydroxylase HpnE [Acidimicrobiales bacterium]|nr:hydroxysqualene dehydroxylase HpnE [Acidimicrobiales bacterium]